MSKKTWKALFEATHGQEIKFAANYVTRRQFLDELCLSVAPTMTDWIRSNPVIPTLPRLTGPTA